MQTIRLDWDHRRCVHLLWLLHVKVMKSGGNVSILVLDERLELRLREAGRVLGKTSFHHDLIGSVRGGRHGFRAWGGQGRLKFPGVGRNSV